MKGPNLRGSDGARECLKDVFESSSTNEDARGCLHFFPLSNILGFRGHVSWGQQNILA
jgi:hypothetical protein